MKEITYLLTAIGLMLDVYGVGIVWRYGLPNHIPIKKTKKPQQSLEERERHLIETDQINEEYLLFKNKSLKGIKYVFFGFVLQLVSIYISFALSMLTRLSSMLN